MGRDELHVSSAAEAVDLVEVARREDSEIAQRQRLYVRLGRQRVKSSVTIALGDPTVFADQAVALGAMLYLSECARDRAKIAEFRARGLDFTAKYPPTPVRQIGAETRGHMFVMLPASASPQTIDQLIGAGIRNKTLAGDRFKGWGIANYEVVKSLVDAAGGTVTQISEFPEMADPTNLIEAGEVTNDNSDAKLDPSDIPTIDAVTSELDLASDVVLVFGAGDGGDTPAPCEFPSVAAIGANEAVEVISSVDVDDGHDVAPDVKYIAPPISHSSQPAKARLQKPGHLQKFGGHQRSWKSSDIKRNGS